MIEMRYVFREVMVGNGRLGGKMIPSREKVLQYRQNMSTEPSNPTIWSQWTDVPTVDEVVK
jgi:hypothetical protein